MNDLKRIQKIMKHIDDLDDNSFLNGIRLELNERLSNRKIHLKFIESKEICPDCNGKGGHLESYNDGTGQRDVDWCKCYKCKGTGYIDKI